MPQDIHAKTHMVLVGIFPQVFYASALLPIGSQHANTLRTSIANAILGPSVSRNSAIAIQVLPKMMDPMVVLIQNAICQAHRFLHKATPGTVQSFLRIVATHDGASHHCSGPASCLAYYLTKIGWHMDAKGWIQTSAFQWHNLLTTSRKTWKRLIQVEWEQTLLTLYTDRKALRGMPPINKTDTSAILTKFPPKDQNS